MFDTVKGSINIQLTEREYLSILILTALISGGRISKGFADAFLRQQALISQLHLSERLVEAPALDEEAGECIEEFCEEACAILSSGAWASNMSDFECSCDVADLIDGRLLAACLQDTSIGINKTYQSLLKAILSLGPKNFSGGQAADGKETCKSN
jgi:ATP-dependent RNA helicase DDX60